jgi:hypothetical protein
MNSREIKLIGATLRNGRIYFPSTDVKFFPLDSFGDRVREGHKGRTVTFHAGGRKVETDIRISSRERLSPRCSFGPFLKQVDAQEGARLRITRLGDREYQVEYLA